MMGFKRYIWVTAMILFLGSYPIASFGANPSMPVFQDSLRVMTYNILNFGSTCQGQPIPMLIYLKTIVEAANPDVVGLVKMESIKTSQNDMHGVLPYGFADSIVKAGFDAAYPNRYDHSTYSDAAGSGNNTLLIFDKNKLGFVKMSTLLVDIEDFNLFQLYYKDPNLGVTHDTTFLYFVLNHTSSGTDATDRDRQDTLIRNALKKRFLHLPNLINMGDFNLHNSSEIGYSGYVAYADSNFKFYDAPFLPDKKLNYPLSWDQNPAVCSNFLTTSTRASSSLPNSCGTSGGAKSWYDHILMSPWILHNENYVGYVPNSYHVFGNDGKRIGISINDSTSNGKNGVVSSTVANALWQFSNKYPVMLTLGVGFNSTGTSLADPEIHTGISPEPSLQQVIKVTSVFEQRVHCFFPPMLVGEIIEASLFDLSGRCISNDSFTLNDTFKQIETGNIAPGIYLLHFKGNQINCSYKIIKE